MAEEFDVRASHRFLPMSPQKVRRVMDVVRGMPALEAVNTLVFTTNAAARPVAKLVRSAIANAEENFGMDPNGLFIHTIYADEGPTRRWRRFGARGRFKPIKKRSAHIQVVLRERVPTEF